ncbi:pyruvate dehydrogenase (acetyl-transferring) E1 component subunit alpha (plasmid) [Haloferax mediterranei ATCC 33500]|uniref:2-oxo acid dehydrogenase n=1 Tax=Haloferax mediterranei (strain ATCC 33500 / DSM 1411 / JCM 8866 / NBRC 14739 / NCIMB 2177 / R-4) TaxID=523841 RepID=I3RAA5_HALMT|nr:pyruvate dehydrogenase (acetyl-transferring) E1 component subunit alpha [Haloferax mediterranei]AFK21165.1 Pyruvate dehydrogenase E1 component subunit alpha [Haloferax mediterranei ATCC 33500]AHZ24716.1 2-oxo acid dehydrogenase [Haloferax mediterranei ATCC 33500]ELZ97499.1 Pyruvate dehydrogenase E1 component subunit alpha [Haloferax mediterranei ATCC 33500]MDX5990209.1 pyruvate dehydrogenase (acetyl-transferring) E1 component subunit alpha [Haloferax mediterranei ATCC 33500]QCQ76722.1 pyruv
MSAQKELDQQDTSSPVPTDEQPVQILDKDGNVRPNATVPDLSDEELVSMYEDIKLARRFDQRAISFQRQGRIATYAPMTGQEGAQVATSYALNDQDWLFPTYREHAAKYVHGVRLASLLKPLRGIREGYAVPDGVNVMPEYIPIATQVPQAMGMAWGHKLQEKTDRAVLCHLGDGATSEGDFHEGLNFAGVFDVPAVFVCNNNQWAISVPRERQTASETIAQKAQAYGIESVRVDGLDPLAVYQVTNEALNKAKNPARDERRPTLIEAVLYRYGAHTTADDPSVYRDGDEADEWKEKDPVDRLQKYLYKEGILDERLEAELDDRIEAKISDAIAEAERAEADPNQIFEYVYDEMPDRLREQQEELNALREKYGDEPFNGVLE